MFRRKNKDTGADFERLHHKTIRCVSIKDMKTYRETILGRDGIINVADGEFIIVCQNAEVLRRPLVGLEIGEFMSHDGFTLRDLNDSDSEIINVYYTK